MKYLTLSFVFLVLLLGGCLSSSDDKTEVRVDAFSDFLLFMRSNSAKQGDTLVVKMVADPLPLPIGMGESDTLILYKKGFDLTASLPAHIIDTQPIHSVYSVVYKYTYYAADAHPATPVSCSIDNHGKKFLKEPAYDTSDVFQERPHNGTRGYYRLVDTTEAVTALSCAFYSKLGYYVEYGKLNSNLAVPLPHYYGDIIIKY